ncbi:MAG TPA: TetR/AcrR family transcriptional regulator [Sporichthya sp.]|nr:TetR/AcrR family transcriptional regulator [Sporichthya sp.]
MPVGANGRRPRGRSATTADDELRGAEEAALVSRLPQSPRLRELLDRLEEIMLAEGFLHLNTDELPSRLRCSKATLYRLAENRFALFGMIIDRWLARMRDDGWARSEAAGDDCSARLVEYLRAGPLAIENTTAAFWRDLRSFPQGYEALIAHQRKRVTGLEEIITAGVAAGVFECEHPRLISELFLNAVRQIVEPDFALSAGVTVQEGFDAWYRVVEFGLIGSTSRSRSPLRTTPAKPGRRR